MLVAYADDPHEEQQLPKFDTVQSASRVHAAVDVRSACATGGGAGLRTATHAAFWHSA